MTTTPVNPNRAGRGIILVLVILAGCTAAKFGATRGLLGQARTHVTAAIPHADDEGKSHLNAAVEKIDKADKQVSKDAHAYGELEQRHAALENSASVKVGRFISRALWVIVGAFGVALVLRVASQGITGPAGTIMALASTGILGVLSGGVSWVQAAFDNFHFRRQAKGETK